MSQKPISRSADLTRLRNEGYDLEIRLDHSLVKDVPYVAAGRIVKRGTLVMTLKLAGDRTVIVSRQGPGIYVQSLMLNGTPYPGTWLPLSKIQPGVTQLRYTMSRTPNTERGTLWGYRPPSFR